MNLFVANLNPSTTTKDLQNLFEHYGLVRTVKIIFDHSTGRSKCYGFVEMPDHHEAGEALNELNNTLFQESIMTVKESKPTDSRISDDRSGYMNRNGVARSSVNIENHEKNQNTATFGRPQRENDSLRNFGYRGSGYRSFR